MLQSDGGDAQVHVPDIQFQVLQLFEASDRPFGEGQYGESPQHLRGVRQATVGVGQLWSVLRSPHKGISTGKLLLDRDDGNRQLFDRLG